MAVSREVLDELRHLIRPVVNRIANTAARAIVRLVDDSTKLQTVQIEILKGEVRSGEHVQPYGFSSVPLEGADTAAVIFPGGDRSHPIVVAVADRRYRPTGGEPGEVTVYNNTGASIRITKDGDIVATPASGRHVMVSTGGTVDSLVTKTEFNAHTHPAPGGATSAPTTPATGTTVLKAQ